jgi:hypothetical protein
LFDHNQDGTLSWIGGGTGAEQAESIFLRALRNVLSPVENPRYLLVRRVWRIYLEDYFAVPDILARKKELAEHLLSVGASLSDQFS